MELIAKLFTAARAVGAEAAENAVDRNAIRILEQELREAAAGLDRARVELASAMATETGERRRLTALEAKITELEASAREALAESREDDAERIATRIATLSNERRRQAAIVNEQADHVARQRDALAAAKPRLAELSRQLRTVKTARDAGRMERRIRREAGDSLAKIAAAEETLARIRETQQREADERAAFSTLHREDEACGLHASPLGDPAFHDPEDETAEDVLARLRRGGTQQAKPDDRSGAADPTDKED